MGIFMDNVAILKSSRLRLIGVANQIDRPFLVWFDETPFDAAWKSGAAAAAQSRRFHLVDDVLARHRHGFLQLLIAALSEVAVNVSRPICATDVFKYESMLERMRRLRIADCGLRIGEKI